MRSADRYVVKQELAAGGMGTVCRVFDRSAREERAMKRPGPNGLSDPALIKAFEQEYRVLAGLDHPRIIRVFDYGVDEGGPFYTMELLDGEDLRRLAPVPYRAACGYLRDVATSLALLHARRLLHRDPSPGNVRVMRDGHCKLLDFGALSAFGNSRLVMGTPPLIPPEALEGAPLDQRADLYSLGALAYWMLTGRHAYPAREISDLEHVWKTPPRAPSTIVPGIPADLDALLLALLSANPLARPTSAAEVIARLNVSGELAPEQEADAERLAESFLRSARFVGHASKLEKLHELTTELLAGRGRALRIEAVAGMGRSRFLEELGLRAQIAGAGVLRIDASTYRDSSSMARALAVRLLDSFGTADELGRGSLDGWFAEVSRKRPLIIEVDNIEEADDASLGFLLALAVQSASCPLMLVVTEGLRPGARLPVGLSTLRSQCQTMTLEGLSPFETRELALSLFGDPPGIGRFAEWLYSRTAGSPLHCIEVSRQLLLRGVIRYVNGIWILPPERFDTELPAELQGTLSKRLSSLSSPACRLAECLSLCNDRPTLALCGRLTGEADGRRVLALLDELARNDVFYADRDGYRFSSTALRAAILGSMDDIRRQENHRRLGDALVGQLGPDDHALRIEAGWHLIRGGDDLQGARLIAEVARHSARMPRLFANLRRAGSALEAALQVYELHKGSAYQRMPLLAALAHSGYYEDRICAERYGSKALDVCEDLAGVRAARRLRPLLGRWVAMVLGLTASFARFHLTPRRERPYPFSELLVQLFGVVTALSGTAALCLDVERAESVAKVIEIFSALPERFAAAGIHDFCSGLREIGREQQALVFEHFDILAGRFGNRRYYKELPDSIRDLYVCGALFARGAVASSRADAREALECADALEAGGFKLYAMIASQIRFLCYANRGELAKAAQHHEQVELHAARMGSVWQVETWEQPNLLPLYLRLEDVVALTRAADRLEAWGRTVPSLKRYATMARIALLHVQHHDVEEASRLVESEMAKYPPRSYLGWASTHSFMARAYNRSGRFAEAKQECDRVLPYLTEADREYVALYIDVDLEMAIAQAGLGQFGEAFARIDALLERFRGNDNPLLQGSLHETRARIAHMAGRTDEFRHGLEMTNHWFRGTGTPALIARCEQLAAVGDAQASLGRGEPPCSGPVPESQTVVAVRRVAS